MSKKVVVTTKDRGFDKLRSTSVDGRVKSMSSQKGDTTREYTGVRHGVLGATPSGTFKKK